ncbi:hypothetical protein EVA_01676 [gut metagenome]|uniref:Uncharacterized protein n=1 Tax=gut metagenome TaxID=749906 RepID=J9GQV0_9ZZZZ
MRVDTTIQVAMYKKVQDLGRRYLQILHTLYFQTLVRLAFTDFKAFEVDFIIVEGCTFVECFVFKIFFSSRCRFALLALCRRLAEIQIHIHVFDLLRSFSFGTDDGVMFQRFTWDDFFYINEETSFFEGVEHKLKVLFFVLDEFREFGFFHDINVFVSTAYAHVFARNLQASFPFFITEVERSHLVVRIATRFENGLVQVEECSIAVYFQFSDKAIDFIGDKFDSKEHNGY